jgi:hypothetical protein
MKIRKQVYQLTPDDLNRFPIWEFALEEEGEEGQDEATVRPYKVSGALEPSDGMFVVKASFALADGTEMQGYLNPPVNGDISLGALQPIIVSNAGQIVFWCGRMTPSPDRLAMWYQFLGRDASRVFPIRFESQVELVDGPVSGSITGFMVLADVKAKTIKTLT